MRRITFMVLVLALLCASAANGSPDPSAKPRSGTASTTTAHKKVRHSANRATRHKAGHAAKRVSIHVASARKHAVSLDVHRVPSRLPVRIPSVEKTQPEAKPLPAAEAEPAADPLQATEVDRPTETATPDKIEATDTAVRPAPVETASLRKARGPMPPPLRGNHASLVRQNEKSEADNLERIEDDDDLDDRIARGMLVPVPISAALAINGNLPENRRYCRPWTANFLADLAHAHASQFHRPLVVSSAVRTVEYQKQLEKVNGNAASAEGDIASPHLTGATIDIAKQGLTRQQIGWMRAWLLPLENAGMIDVEEEFHQSCFHITVYKSYVPPRPARNAVAWTTAGHKHKASLSGASGF
jgi:hypothetical protein